ncbi:hypothetical protein F5051DRAFT_338449 [Lentinula edodes]|nr:hypothetical protein F5051DRAFT_338449 [Lentinula edodes]KAJ3923426.1 hypothetical protein F5877DRAFT_31465 [Lentinula edodes]
MLEHVIPTPTATIIKTLISEQTPYPPSPRVQENLPIDINVPNYKPRLRLPRIDGGTLPRPNEDLFSFIERRDAQRLRAISSETAVERQSRLSREKNAEKDRAPGRKGARVYYWDLVEGVRVRTAVGRNNYEDIWERYGSRQRRYDSVADEWEVCTDLDPEDGPDYSFDDDDDDDSDCFISVQTHMNEETGFREDIEDVAYYRFGFLKQPPPDNRGVVLKSQVWNKVLGLIGCGRSPPSPGPDDYIKLQLCNFITRLMDAVDVRNAPEVYDLAVRNSLMRPPVPFEVDVLSSFNGHYFLIQAQGATDHEPYLIALRSAATVMEIARREWGPKTEDIITCLIEHGMPFNTLMASYPPRKYRAIPCRRPAMLGLRPATFEPTLQDYCAYEILRDDFLRSARGRAALLAGGIISRLAREVVDVNDVCDGPTGHALQEGEYSLCVWEMGQNRAFWDDQLTNEEMDLICGSYEVVTGTCLSLFENFLYKVSSRFSFKGWHRADRNSIMVAPFRFLEILRP